MEKPAFIEEMKEKTKDLAKDIIILSKSVKKDQVSYILIDQLIRSASSTAANYRAVCRARSGREFFAKLSITIEEVDETLFWLELMTDTEIIENNITITNLKEKTKSVLSILARARKTYTSKNLKR